MSYRSREDYLKTQRARYRRGTRAQKSRILDEGCSMFGMHRKSLIRALGRPARVASRRRGPKPHYGSELLGPLKVIWLAAQQPCSKRLKAALPLWLGPYERRHGTLAPEMRGDLLAMSAATIDRLLRPIRARRRKGLCATRSARHLEGQIPIRTRFQEVEGPGWFEADTVAHCGSSLAGAFVWSLTLTDIWSGWTENCAVWNRSSRQIVEHIRNIEQGLAFEIEGFDSDNGSEFLNHRLYRYLRDRLVPIEFTRSRPYRKNDNAHVEQKQWTHVRQLLGYDRFEDRRLVARINDLYRNEWRALVNFFLPTMQLIAKHREGGRLRRYHGTPRTPYQRLMDSPKVSQEGKEQLRCEMQSLDPFDLRERIETKLRAIFRLAGKQRKQGGRTRRAVRHSATLPLAPRNDPQPTRAVEMTSHEQPVHIASLCNTACSQDLENSIEFPTVPQPR